MVGCTLGMFPRTHVTRRTYSGLWPPCIGLRLQESLLDGETARQRMSAAESQTVAVSTAEERYTHAPNGLSTGREPPEETGVSFDIGGQLGDPVEAPQTVPNVDARPRQLAERMAPIGDGATALQDRCIAEYEARLQNSCAMMPDTENRNQPLQQAQNCSGEPDTATCCIRIE